MNDETAAEVPTPAPEAAHAPTALDGVREALGLDNAQPAPESPDKPDSAPEPHRDAAGPHRDAAGRFAKSDAKPGDVPPPVPAQGAAPVAAPAVPPDDIPPEDLSEKSRERFTSLASERNQWRDRANQWQQVIASTGADAKQFGEMLEYTRLSNSGTPEGLRAALTMAKDAVRALSAAVGEDVQSIDVFSPYPDIASRVDDGDVDRKTALELVRARQQDAAIQAQQQAAAQQQAQQAAVQTATAQLDQMGQQLRSTDPEFDRKLEVLKSVIPVIAEHTPPEQWAAAFLRAYHGVQVPPQRMPASPQPISGHRSGATGLRPEPKSDLDVVRHALGLG